MRVLAVVPDGNVMDRVRWLAECNPFVEWSVVGMSSDCDLEPRGWAGWYTGLGCDWRETKSYPQDESLPGIAPMKWLDYERACQQLRSPLLGYWFHYHMDELQQGILDLEQALFDRPLGFDAVATWGERGWYNEIAGEFSREYELPWCRLERATFPGMFVCDGTGLEQGRCELAEAHSSYWKSNRWDVAGFSGVCPQLELNRWFTVAPWQAIEAQPRTTLGMVEAVLDGRPTVFVPLQVPVDTNMIFRTTECSNNYELLCYVREHYPNYQVLVKKHPADGFTSDHNLQTICDEFDFTLVNMATHAVLQRVDQVVSINSQVIIEAWMHGVETEILGKPAFDLPDENTLALLHTLRFGYYIEPWQFEGRLEEICRRG